MRNQKYKEFSAGRAGYGKIDLATGILTFVHENMESDANILPINIAHVYSSKRASDAAYNTYGKGFRLNLQQTLKKNKPNDINDTVYTYRDAGGIEHTFKDRYYYVNTGGKRTYLPTLSDITVDADGKLTYDNGYAVYDVFMQQITESGLILQSELKAFKGSKKLETRHEEVVRLTEEIFQLEKSITDLKYSVTQYDKINSFTYESILGLQKTIEENSISLEKNSITNYNNLKQKQIELDKAKDALAINSDKNIAKVDEIVRQIEKQSLVDQNSLMGQKESLNKNQEKLRKTKNSYDESEREELKIRYAYLKEIADKEIQKYENLKGNKEDVLKKLTVQIPVNFILNKDNVTMGFNADGNLVTLFDNYDNQAAIIYENGVIAKVVDADDREIVFKYENKNSVRGKLMSITDFKGHKISFIYDSSDSGLVKKIKYPDGEITEFTYTRNGLLSEMLSPSKTGVQIEYNFDNKVESIAELTMMGKIGKNGVFDGEKIAKKINFLTYESGTTVVRDIKNDILESNSFGSDLYLNRVQALSDNKLLSLTAYNISNVFETGKHYDFVMTADDIAEDGISEMDIISTIDNIPVTLDGFTAAKKEWQADLTKLDPNRAEYFLCGSATALTAEKTPKRKKTAYCENHCYHDMNSTYRRFEYKVQVDYAGKTPNLPPDIYTPIETEDTIKTLYLNTYQPDSVVLQLCYDYSAQGITGIYPLFGNGTSKLYYSIKYYIGVNYGYALFAGETLLWCNKSYATENKVSSGWQQTKVNISSWGPISVYRDLTDWGQVLSKNNIFYNKQNPNLAKDNEDPDIDEFIVGFDYRIKGRQHVALPITLREENGKSIMPKKITVIGQYKQSQGEAVFERPNLIKGKVAYSKLDGSGNIVSESCSPAEKIAVNEQTGNCSTVKSSVTTVYNEANLPKEKRTIYDYLTENGSLTQTAVEKWFYNPQGSVIEHWSYDEGKELTSGIDITETVYDKRGNAVKSFSYNSMDASTKFYSEQEQAENGRVLADIDELGLHKTYYEYDDVTGKVKSAAAPNGAKLSYAHDTNTDEVTAITLSTKEGEANVTNRVYTAGYLTELTSGGNTVNFEYDQNGRKSAVYLNDKTPYAVFEYQERTEAGTTDAVTATLAPTNSASSYTVKTELDKNGNLIRVSEGNDSLSLATSIENTYFTSKDKDREGLLKTSEDKLSGMKTEYAYNCLKQPLSATVRDSETNAVISSETAEYNEYGQLNKRKIVSGAYTHDYGYRYKSNFERDPESVFMPYGLSSMRIKDANGRIKECELTVNDTPLAREYYYFRKHGDHGTNQISSVRYGERKNGEFVVKDGISYTYDECGNISEIRENGKLSTRYGYDLLNRLIREDNAQFGKTTLFSYDNNGNILSKREAAYCLRDTEKITEFADEKEYAYDAEQPDRLTAFGDEGINGYDAIGNPTTYRDKRLTWQKGRQLASVTDNVETIAFTYDAIGRRTCKRAEGETTKYVYAGDMLIREERADENNIVFFGDDLITGDSFVEGGEIVIDSVNKSVIEYLYGQNGVAGLVYDGAKYYFRRNVQGDITRIYDIDGTLKACYTYDAWGNHKVLDSDGNVNTDPCFIGNVNPFRYRGYYYDVETRLYFCASRYYDPEVGRWINADSIEYLDPEIINGLNLYAYCLNNPVMMVDENGNKPNWKKIFGWVVNAFIAVAAVAAVVVVAVGTVASGGLLGAVLVGAGVGALVGMGGSIIAQGGFKNSDPWQVAKAGGIGATIGAISGVASWSVGTIGQALGQQFGFALSNMTHISSSVQISKVFSTASLMSAGHYIGGILGGFGGGAISNYFANKFFGKQLDIEQTMDQGIKGELPLWLIKIFRWLVKK